MFDAERPYSMGDADISVTTLIDSPQISQLRSRHHEEMEEDISDRAMSILGTAVHEILRVGAPENTIPEERLFATIHDTVISGQIDLITHTPDGYIISDYKTVRGAALQFNPEGKIEWEKQLNCYAALARLNSREIQMFYFEKYGLITETKTVAGLEVVAIIRDWTAAQAKRNPDYPQASIVRIPIKMWPASVAAEYISDRISTHYSDENNGIRDHCSDEERWASPPEFAVYEYTQAKTLRKRATRVFDNRTDAETFSLDLNGPYEIEERPLTYRRCDGNYCGVSSFCQQNRRNK